jgi:dihydrofolate synthase/folylpolyglutamate synthase
VTAEVGTEAASVIAAEAELAEAELFLLGKDFEPTENKLAVGGRYLSLRTSGGEYDDLFLPLHGAHQGFNAAVATEAVTRFLPAQPLSQEVIAQGLGTVGLPGRLETIRPMGEEGPTVVLDVAHNPDGMSALINALSEEFAFERAIVVLGVLADKDYRGMLSELSRLPCRAIATRPQNVRSVEPQELKVAADERGIDCEVIENVAVAVETAVDHVGETEIVCVTGSHYLVGEARWLFVPE